MTKLCRSLLGFFLASLPFMPTGAGAQTWTADNGNGTYSNPLFFDEFSDPDMIRVGSDFYLTGTSMHSMPGLPIGLSNQIATLTGGKQMPYFRLFGTHYCGPGGGGTTNRALAPACKAHDDCYAAAGLSAASNGSGASLTLDQAAAAQGCNQALYDAARGHPNQLNGSAPLRQWLTERNQVPFGHLAPGTEAKSW